MGGRPYSPTRTGPRGTALAGEREPFRDRLPAPLLFPGTWTWEIRPVIDKQLGGWDLAFNPAVDRSFHGLDVSKGVTFAPTSR